MIARRSRFRSFVAGVLAILGPAIASAQVSWSSLSWEKALAQAAENGQLVLVDIYADHCGQCAQLDAEVWDTLDGAVLVQELIPVKLDAVSAEGEAFARRYPVTGLPAVILLGADGAEIDRVIGYHQRSQFLDAMTVLRSGIDPTADLEAALEASPASAPLMQELLEKYLHRKRKVEAEALLERILQADPDNAAQLSEKALMALAKYESHFVLDRAKSESYWRRLAGRFPDASSIGAAVKETFDFAKERGELASWVSWACGLTRENPEAGRLAYNVAIFANRHQLRGACLADAARAAKRLGVGPAWMDSIAVVLEGK